MESDGATLLVGTWQLYLFVPVFHVAIFLPGFLFLDHAGADGGPQTTAKIQTVLPSMIPEARAGTLGNLSTDVLEPRTVTGS